MEGVTHLCGNRGAMDRTVWPINIRKRHGTQRPKGQVLGTGAAAPRACVALLFA